MPLVGNLQLSRAFERDAARRDRIREAKRVGGQRSGLTIGARHRIETLTQVLSARQDEHALAEGMISLSGEAVLVRRGPRKPARLA